MPAPTRFSRANERSVASSSWLDGPTALQGAGAGRVRRVEHVDVDRDVDRPVAEARRADGPD
jgi:hypothetical protein